MSNTRESAPLLTEGARLEEIARTHELFYKALTDGWFAISNHPQHHALHTITPESPAHLLNGAERAQQTAKSIKDNFGFKMHVSLDATRLTPASLENIIYQIVTLLCQNMCEKNGITQFKLYAPTTILRTEQQLKRILEKDAMNLAALQLLLLTYKNRRSGAHYSTCQAIRMIEVKSAVLKAVYRELKNPIVIYVDPDIDLRQFITLCKNIQKILFHVPTDNRYNTVIDLACGDHFIFRTESFPVALAKAAGILTYEGGYVNSTGRGHPKQMLDLLVFLAAHSPFYQSLTKELLQAKQDDQQTAVASTALILATMRISMPDKLSTMVAEETAAISKAVDQTPLGRDKKIEERENEGKSRYCPH